MRSNGVCFDFRRGLFRSNLLLLQAGDVTGLPKCRKASRAAQETYDEFALKLLSDVYVGCFEKDRSAMHTHISPVWLTPVWLDLSPTDADYEASNCRCHTRKDFITSQFQFCA